MDWVMGFSLCQAPTSVGYDCICTILVGLIEDSPQARPTSISMELKRMGEICIGKNRCGGAQSLQVVKGLLAPVTTPDGSLFLLPAFSPVEIMQGLGYLCTNQQ